MTGVSTSANVSTPAAKPGGRWIRLLVLVNLGLIALQAVSAGFVMSGSGPAILLHARGGLALGLGALFQVSAAVVLWVRRRAPGWVVRSALMVFVLVVLQIGAGHTKRYWFHVPVGVALFGGLLRHSTRVA
jgi:hypothetical protein